MIHAKDTVFLMLFGEFLSLPWPGDGPPASLSARFCVAPMCLAKGRAHPLLALMGLTVEWWETKSDQKPVSNDELQEGATKAIKRGCAWGRLVKPGVASRRGHWVETWLTRANSEGVWEEHVGQREPPTPRLRGRKQLA